MTAPTPAEFILARVAEWEVAARECAGVPWVMLEGVGASQVLVDPAVIREEKWRYGGLGHVATTSHDGSYAAHIAAHDPSRAIAQCAAYRSLVEEHSCVHSACPGSPTLTSDDGEQDGTYGGPCAVLRNLASIWADHADFNPDWRP